MRILQRLMIKLKLKLQINNKVKILDNSVLVRQKYNKISLINANDTNIKTAG